MKLGLTLNLGGFNSLKIESSEHGTAQDCARDLIAEMTPMIQAYPILKQRIDEIKAAYKV